jgi:hypothetical protein
MSKRGDELLEAMRQSQDNWTRHDLENLYLDFGFEIRKGAKHDMAIHNKYKQLRNTLPNHKSFAKGYITSAIKSIDLLQKITSGDKQ